MKNEPLVTVAIATYNRPETLKYAVESVLWQTYENFELWVIGDKCTDNTEEVLQPYLKDPRVNWYNLPKNSGYQSRPNNEAIRRGSGKYISYLNHDDIWLPNHLSDCVNHIENSNADIVFAIIEWIYSFKLSEPDIPILPTMPRLPETIAVVHKREVINKIGYWKDFYETYEDPRVDFFRSAYRQNLRFEIVPSLTSLKFLWDEENYHDKGPQELYFKKIKEDPAFINRELSGMLIRAHEELGKPITLSRFQLQIFDKIREIMVRLNMAPARLKFWRRKGSQIEIWRKQHQLDG
ncbi:glycosyl transferase [Fulvivirga imtechensis AK7]|uniref:Glycosyl transferase n=1 Tax=Fulvivirga imtechensis AK7 TaxID=1237149 RepID=L8JYT9_9BACT|nr:glycosyltransferase family A protein [Fulvivirga imtechensis]ELR72799.1 glycosyl transferase [Fulvivirga imtechensis AK7]